MTALLRKKTYTPEEYLALETKADIRSEYVDGSIYQMAGGTESHIQISFNATRLLSDFRRGKCRAYQSEMKVWVERVNTFFYPDVTVVCGERIFYQNRTDIVTNPVLLIEVLPESTKEYDKNDKFLSYQNLETLREYVLISQNRPAVQQYIRQNDGSWKYLATIGIDSEVTFESVETTLKLNDIYDLVEFEESENE
jgi:Uma2 family endonuclease